MISFNYHADGNIDAGRYQDPSSVHGIGYRSLQVAKKRKSSGSFTNVKATVVIS